MKKKFYQRRLFYLPAKLVLAFSLLTWLYLQDVIDPAPLTLLAAKPSTIAAIMGMAFLTIVYASVRWQLLLWVAGISIPFRSAFAMTYMGIFFGNYLPGQISGDLVRAYYVMRKSPVGKTASGVSIVVDRMLGLMGVVLMASVGGIFAAEKAVQNPLISNLILLFLLLVIVPVAVVGLIVLLIVRADFVTRIVKVLPEGVIGRLIKSGLSTLAAYRNYTGLLLVLAVGSALSHFLFAVNCYLIADAMGSSTLRLSDYVFVSSMAIMVNMLPITPGGLGVGETAFGYLSRLLEAVPTVFPYGTVLLTFRILSLVVTLPALGIFLMHRNATVDQRT